MSIVSCQEKFKTFLSKKGLRLTNQRMAILDAAFSKSGHFTAEDLLDSARTFDESVSRATVYRTLPILTSCGLIREIDVGKDIKFYLADPENRVQQAQVVCLDCDKIFEIDAPFMEWYGTAVASRLGLAPESQRLQVTARCVNLRSMGICKNRE